jgi:hypothetical protein
MSGSTEGGHGEVSASGREGEGHTEGRSERLATRAIGADGERSSGVAAMKRSAARQCRDGEVKVKKREEHSGIHEFLRTTHEVLYKVYRI